MPPIGPTGSVLLGNKEGITPCAPCSNNKQTKKTYTLLKGLSYWGIFVPLQFLYLFLY